MSLNTGRSFVCVSTYTSSSLRFYAFVKVLAELSLSRIWRSHHNGEMFPYRAERRSLGIGGGKRTRTADILLAKQALYQLSYTPTQWAILDSNQGPHPYQGCALTT
jgi:hypothetical protein